ncbi:MAG TPA: type 1 glutamine amidotransferase [Burkholderiales bacterium]|nr:type 1 glutamine amidotransferase [Burkholderiales bacterium]
MRKIDIARWRRSIGDETRSLRGFLARRLPPPPLRIGMSARLSHPRPEAKGLQSKRMQYLEQSVAHWVMSREVLVFMVPTVDKDGLLHRSEIRVADYARALDALVLQGGADVSPLTYGEEPLDSAWAGDRMRDVYEIELLHEFVEAGKPVLGICRGAQLINVAFGGTLYQDIGTQLAGARKHVSDAFDKNLHEMRIEPGSGLARLYPGVERTRINSIHHQSIKALGRNLAVEARSEPDGVVEAIRSLGKSYVFAVQWHPEFHTPGDDSVLDSAPILDEFLRAARR